MKQNEESTNRRSSFGQWLEVILAILIIGGGLVWLAHMHAQQDSPSSGSHHGRGALTGPMPVSTTTAKKGDINITLDALGTVTPLATVTVKPQIGGQLMELDFKEGQTVKKGDALALIDPRPYEASLAQYEGQLQRDQALLDGAVRNLARYTKLAKEDSIALQQRDDQKALVKQYQGNVATDEAQINNAKLNISYCHITAPVSGRVGLRQVDAGNYVQLSDASGIVVIAQTQPMSVVFSLPEDNIPEIMKRMAAGATLPVTALDRNQSTQLAMGKLDTVDNVIDTSTGTVKMRALFDNADNALFPNQFVNVKLLVNTLQGVIIVPSSAVRNGAPGDFVYVVKPDSTVAMTPVKLGPTEGDNVSVTSGLSEGDVVVSEGADKLKDGATVLLPGTAAPGESGAPAPEPTPQHQASPDKAGQNPSGYHHHHKQQE